MSKQVWVVPRQDANKEDKGEEDKDFHVSIRIGRPSPRLQSRVEESQQAVLMVFGAFPLIDRRVRHPQPCRVPG